MKVFERPEHLEDGVAGLIGQRRDRCGRTFDGGDGAALVSGPEGMGLRLVRGGPEASWTNSND
ncbi:MAG: hypothetical protein AAGK22_18180 [Acidobacteriota bacterium]